LDITGELGLYVAVFAAILLLFGGVGVFVASRAGRGDRWEDISKQSRDTRIAEVVAEYTPTAGAAGNDTGLFDDARGRFGALNDKSTPIVRQKLIQAGFRGERARSVYYFSRIVLAILLPAGALLYLLGTGAELTVQRAVITIFGGVAIGFYAPPLFVRWRADRRREQAKLGLPDALDMMLVCVEAGLSMVVALNRVAAEIGQAHPVLAEELNITALEMQAGKGYEDSLRGLGERLGVEEIKSLVSLLIQSESLGASISQTLRIYSTEMRARRLIDAEERGAKIPVYMTFPLIGFILPSLMLTILAPVIVKFARVLLPTLTGG
jgi:tight adherence protein C